MSEEEQQPEPLEEKVERHRNAILQVIEAWEEDHQRLKVLTERVKRVEGNMIRTSGWKAQMMKEVRTVKNVGVQARNGVHVLNDRLKRLEEQLERMGKILETIVLGVRPPSEEEEEEDPPSQ